MGTIAFHTSKETLYVAGSERMRAAVICHGLLMGTMEKLDADLADHPHWIRLLLPLGLSFAEYTGDQFAQSLSEWLRHKGVFLFPREDGTLIAEPGYVVALNTALVLASDAVRLLVRLHGQCELHCFVTAEHAPWLARIIQGGLALRVLSPDVGWEQVYALLSRQDEPLIACSFSDAVALPDVTVAASALEADPAAQEDLVLRWVTLTDAQRWQATCAALRDEAWRPGLQLRPDDWASYRFGASVSALDLPEIGIDLAALPSAWWTGQRQRWVETLTDAQRKELDIQWTRSSSLSM